MSRKPTRNDPFKELKMKDIRVVDAAVAKAVMEEAARHFIAIRHRYTPVDQFFPRAVLNRIFCHRFSNQFKRSANVQFWVPMCVFLLHYRAPLGKRETNPRFPIPKVQQVAAGNL